MKLCALWLLLAISSLTPRLLSSSASRFLKLHAPQPLRPSALGALSCLGKCPPSLALRGGTDQQQQQQQQQQVEEEDQEEEEPQVESEFLYVPTDVRNIPDAVKKACGEYIRYKEEPSPIPGQILDPPIDNFGQVISPEEFEWKNGTGQKLHIRAGEYSWGDYSERLMRFQRPVCIMVRDHIEISGDDGATLNGQWQFMPDSSGKLSSMMFMVTQFVPGRGGGMCLQFMGGDWNIEYCQLRCIAGPLVTIAAASGDANVTIKECLLSRIPGAAVGYWGYGIFAYDDAKVKVVDSNFEELKVAIDASFQCDVQLEGCWINHNRIGVMLHDQAKVSVKDSLMKQNLKGSFCTGIHGKDKAELRLHNVSFQGNEIWCDEDRPKVFEQKELTVDLVNVSLPELYVGTFFVALGLNHTNHFFKSEHNEKAAQLSRWLLGNLTSINTTWDFNQTLNVTDFTYEDPPAFFDAQGAGLD